MKRSPIALACAATMLLLACRNVYKAPAGDGSVTISFSGATKARTLVPNFNTKVSGYDVIAASGTQTLPTQTALPGGSTVFNGLSAGSWTISTYAKDSTGTVIGSGHKTISISSGSNQLVALPMTFGDGGPGKLAIRLDWSATDVNYLEFYLDGASSPLGYITGTATLITAEPLSEGAHTLKLVFKRNGSGGTLAGVFIE